MFRGADDLTEGHRMFLRLLQVNGCLGVVEASKHLQKIIDDNPGITGDRGSLSLGTVLADLKRALVDFHFDVKLSNSERDGKAYLSVVNTVQDSIASDAKFKDSSNAIVLRVILAYFKETEKATLATVDATRMLCSNQERYLQMATEMSDGSSVKFTKVSPPEWAATVARLVETGYLELADNDGNTLIIGPRARAELKNVLDSFLDGRRCSVCNTACVVADGADLEAGKVTHPVCKRGGMAPLVLPGDGVGGGGGGTEGAAVGKGKGKR